MPRSHERARSQHGPCEPSVDPDDWRHSFRSSVSGATELIAHAPFVSSCVADDETIADCEVFRQIQAGEENVVLHADAAEDAYRAAAHRGQAVARHAKDAVWIGGGQGQ